METADAVVLVEGARNAGGTGDVGSEVGAVAGRAQQPALRTRLDS